MNIEADVLVQEVPIRFLPEAGQGLKTWLTGGTYGSKSRELININDLSADIQSGGSVWMSPSAGDDLCRILLLYRGVTKKFITITVPKKYEAQVDFTKFIVE